MATMWRVGSPWPWPRGTQQKSDERLMLIASRRSVVNWLGLGLGLPHPSPSPKPKPKPKPNPNLTLTLVSRSAKPGVLRWRRST